MVVFQPNSVGLVTVMNQAKMQTFLKRRAAKAQRIFAATTKRDPKSRHPVHNADNTTVGTKTYHSHKKDRAGAFVRTDSVYAKQREYGGRTNPRPERTLRKAIRRVG